MNVILKEYQFLVLGFFVVLFIFILLRQRKLKKELNIMKAHLLKSRTKKDIKKDMKQVKKSLTALEILYKDGLLPDNFYMKSKETLQNALEVLKKEL